MVAFCANVYLFRVGSCLHIKYIVLNMNVGPNTIHTIPNEHAEQSLVLILSLHTHSPVTLSQSFLIAPPWLQLHRLREGIL